MSPVDLPPSEDGRRSSVAFGRSVVADALRAADPALADAASREADWRKGYLPHFRALTSHADAVAAPGLASVHARMEVPAFDSAGDLATEVVTGTGTPERELTLPYRGDLLGGDRLRRQLDAWVAAGAIEPSCAARVLAVADNPDWLDLSDKRLVLLGAGAEMGPLPALLAWGGKVIGIDLPRPELWERVTAVAEKSAGRLTALRADLLTQLPEVAAWLARLEGPLVLGNYVYAPGVTHLKLSVAVDALGEHLRGLRDDVALAGLATPTDVFQVPPEAVEESRERWRRRSRRSRAGALITGGRMLRPNYPDGAPPVNDSLVAQQGPNYALAKRIQRWRATVARREGVTVSYNVAPPTWTRSVTSNRLLAAAYSAAHLFDVEVFEPATANRLMAALLVHDLRNPRPPAPAAWQDEAAGAAHGGLWRVAYQPRTCLPLAAAVGLVKR